MTRRPRIEDLYAIAVPEQPALSPDRTQVVYVLRTLDRDADTTVRCLWRVGTHAGEPAPFTRGRADAAPAWSPDGTRVAFLRAQDGPPQVWLMPVAGGEPEPLTALPLGAGAPVWSPDGTRIAFAAPVDLWPKDEERKAPIVTDRLGYLADGGGPLGLLKGVRTHLHVVDVATRAVTQLTGGDWFARGPAWSPDGTRLAYIADLRHGDNLTSPVYVTGAVGNQAGEARSGETETVRGDDEEKLTGLIAGVLWTEHGLIATGSATTDRLAHMHLIDGETKKSLTEAIDRNVMPGAPGYPGAAAQVSGADIVFCVRDRGDTHVYKLGPDKQPVPVVAGPGHTVAGMSVVDGTAVVVLATPGSFGELVTVDLATGAQAVRTSHGATLADVEWFPRVEREFTISDGTVVHGWLTAASPQEPKPLLLDVHGGPHNAWNGSADEIHLYHQELAARGWAVLVVNPRGSDGYGEQFWSGALNAWGRADAADLLEPLDTLVDEGVADPRRLAIAGYSYGGYMTCYLTGRDHRFAAAVAGGVVSDLVSMDGTSDDGHYLTRMELGGDPWQRREALAEMSPITRAHEVRTPTLVLQGANDVRCPIGQAQQWFSTLRRRGVPTRLVLYPDASHTFILDGRPSHRVDFNERIVDWLEQHTQPGEGRHGD
jgi:dipeptidyl aminopeptidase/acylaminoacyl peptidase